jgi:hypothetical protein
MNRDGNGNNTNNNGNEKGQESNPLVNTLESVIIVAKPVT